MRYHVIDPVTDHVVQYVTGWGTKHVIDHVIVWGLEDHVIRHVLGHVMVSQDHVLVS